MPSVRTWQSPLIYKMSNYYSVCVGYADADGNSCTLYICWL